MIAKGMIDVNPVLTHRFPLDKLADAYELHRTGRDGSIKILIELPLEYQ